MVIERVIRASSFCVETATRRKHLITSCMAPSSPSALTALGLTLPAGTTFPSCCQTSFSKSSFEGGARAAAMSKLKVEELCATPAKSRKSSTHALASPLTWRCCSSEVFVQPQALRFLREQINHALAGVHCRLAHGRLEIILRAVALSCAMIVASMSMSLCVAPAS